MNYRRVRGVFIATTLTCSLAVTPALAAPEDSLESLQDEQDSLKEQKSEAQSELSSLQSQLETLLTKTAELEDKLITTGQEITQAEDDLDVAEEKRQDQYDAMKLRIKYIYESGGDAVTLEKILSSGDITSILTQAEYSQKVHEYDREQLQEYAQTVQEIEDLQSTLKTEMANLEELEGEYQAQQEELNTTITSKQDEISNLDGMLQEAARKVIEEQQRQEQAAAAAEESEDETEETGGGTGNTGNTGGSDNSSDNNDTGNDNSNNGGSSGGSDYDEVTGNSIVDRALSQRGKPYAWGAAGPDSYDCSGLVSYALTGSYVHTWSTYDFMGWTQVSDPQPGDICTSWTHCGIYIGNGQMVHAPQTGDVVKVSSVHSGMIYVRY